MNSVIETVQKPLEERGWELNRDGYYERKKDDDLYYINEAEQTQAYEDQPSLIIEIERLEHAEQQEHNAFLLAVEFDKENVEFWAETVREKNAEITRLESLLAQKESVLDKGRALVRSEPIRELLCQYCDRDYTVWFAPNELWNAVALEEDWFLCPSCFTALAEERGIKTTAFFLTTEEDKDDKQKNC